MNRQARHWRHISFVGGLCTLIGFVCLTGYSQRKSNSNQPIDQIKRTIQFDSLNSVLRDTSYYLTMLTPVLANLPSQGDTLEKWQFTHVSLNEETRSLIHRRKEDIVEYFLVNLLWIGTPDEKNRARKELMEKTNLKFTTEQEWSDWWRSKYN